MNESLAQKQRKTAAALKISGARQLPEWQQSALALYITRVFEFHELTSSVVLSLAAWIGFVHCLYFVWVAFISWHCFCTTKFLQIFVSKKLCFIQKLKAITEEKYLWTKALWFLTRYVRRFCIQMSIPTDLHQWKHVMLFWHFHVNIENLKIY